MCSNKGTTMDDYINRDTIIKIIEDEIQACDAALDEDIWISRGLKIALKYIKSIPTADVQSTKNIDYTDCNTMTKL